MTTVEIRSNFHSLIDNISNESVLAKFYEMLLKVKDSKDSQLWSRLSAEEQQELEMIEKQSYDSQNLISHSEVAKKHKKWL